MSEFDDFVREFVAECSEGLDQLENDLVALEQDPHNAARLDNIFRTLHTIKGNSSFFNFDIIGGLAHAGENLLTRIRSGELSLNTEMSDALLTLVDAIRNILQTISATAGEGENPYEDLRRILARLSEGATAEEPQPTIARDISIDDDAATDDESLAKTIFHPGPMHVKAEDFDISPETPDIPADSQQSQPTDEQPADDAEPSVKEIEESPAAESDKPPAAVSDSSVVSDKDDSSTHPKDLSRSDSSRVIASPSSSNIRVGVDLLDKLMNLVGELVLARNQVLQFSSRDDDPVMQTACQHLNLITTELQEGVMKTRMQSISMMWHKYPRIVRDLSRQCGKEVVLEMQGTETELDKSLIEVINDPLTHVIRNAIDHGIESPAEREKNGKLRQGRLLLKAYHEGGKVNIEVTDDGAGIDAQQIREQAVRRGVLSVDEAAAMSSRSILATVFQPGFSTAESITNLSGRGVGMDVVRTNIESIGGTVDIHSTPGEGTTIKIRIPLTLAIIPALMVSSGNGTYAIPQVNLLELNRLDSGQIERDIEVVHGSPIYRLRGELLPLVFLSRELQSSTERISSELSGCHELNVVVLSADDRRFGLVVDDVSSTEEIVVKPLSSILKSIPLYAGATIMGDGSVALILDVVGLARQAGMQSRPSQRHMPDEPTTAERLLLTQNLLVCEVGQHRRVAIPVSYVERLDEIRKSDIEISADQDVLQYRDTVMPLIRMRRFLRDESLAPEGDSMQVVVCRHEESLAGIVVDRIFDIVEQPTELQTTSGQQKKWFSSSLVIHGRITDLINLPELIREVDLLPIA